MTQQDNDLANLEQLVTETLLREQGATPDVDAEWQREATRLQYRHSPRHRIVLWRTVVAVAACVMIAVLLWRGMFKSESNGVIFMARQDKEPVTIIDDNGQSTLVSNGKVIEKSTEKDSHVRTLVVPDGKDAKIVLADGTQVWVNAGSSLTYPSRFHGKTREVTLTGEAYFKVSHDTQHPFIVHAQGISTRVLGTQFNMRCYTPNDTHVTLVEGKVIVKAHKAQTVIHPGEDAQLSSDSWQIKEVNVEDVTCWREGIQLFDNASLRDILIQMGGWYNMNVVCNKTNSLNRRLHYMYDRREPIETSLVMLRELSKVNIKVEKNTIFVE